VPAGEAEDVVSFVFDGSRGVREVVAGIAGVVVEAGGAVRVTVDEESVTATAVAVSETVDEVVVLPLVVDVTLPVVALLLVVVVSLFWHAAASETANATAIAVFADFMMFPPVRADHYLSTTAAAAGGTDPKGLRLHRDRQDPLRLGRPRQSVFADFVAAAVARFGSATSRGC
jgi:hypothetical protein